MDKFDKKMITAWLLFTCTLVSLFVAFKLLEVKQICPADQKLSIVQQKPLSMKINLVLKKPVKPKIPLIKWENEK